MTKLKRLHEVIRYLFKRSTRAHRYMLARERHNSKGRVFHLYKYSFDKDVREYYLRTWVKNSDALDRVGKRWKLI